MEVETSESGRKGDGQDQLGTDYAQIAEKLKKAQSRAVIFSTLLLAAFIFISWVVGISILDSPYRGESQKTIAAMAEMKGEIIHAIGQDSEKIFSGILEAIDNKAQGTMAGISRLGEELILSSDKRIQETVAAITGAQDDTLKRLAQDAAPSGNSDSVGPKQAAAGQRALELGAEALQAGQTDKALLYLINGVNHSPNRMELIQSLADAALKSDSGELMERAIGVLELATMQVAPDDMDTVLGRISELRTKTLPAPAPKLSPDQAVERLEGLSKAYAPGNIWKDGGRVASGLSEIEFFQQIIEISRSDGNDESYIDIINKSGELAKSLQGIQTFLPLYQHIVICVAEMDAISEDNSVDMARFSSVSAAAQGVLAQVWGSLQNLPKPMQDDIREIPAKMAGIDRRLQEKLSEAPYVRAVGLIDTAERDSSGNFTNRIERLTASLSKAAEEAEAITFREKRIQLFERIQNARRNLSKLEIDRRAAYQEWALGCLNRFMSDWNSEKSVSDEEAEGFFYRNDIACIDETLLVPEVARILGRVMTCMTGELSAKAASNIEYKMASGTKKTLGDF